MVRPAYFDSNGMKKGAWSKEEDKKLRDFIQTNGHSNWRLLPILAGLARCGKSCRLRWVNYLRPDLKRGNFAKHERDLIIKLHDQLGNKWSAIAANLPGRTDNEVKNYWHAHIQKRSTRKGAVNRAVIKTQMLEEDQPFQIKSCNVSTPSSNVNIPTGFSVENLENIDVVSSTAQTDQDYNISTEEYYQTYCDDLPLIAEEEGNFGLCQELQNDMSVSSEPLDAGYNLTADSPLGGFWAEPPGEEAISWSFGHIMDMLYC